MPLGMKVLIVLSALSAMSLLLACGVVRLFYVPSGAMEPTIHRGDRVLVEYVSLLWRQPRRGEIVVFSTTDLPVMGPHSPYVKRLVGLPGETLRIENGALLINGVRTPIYNAVGEIQYVFLPSAKYLRSAQETVTVPPNSYFVMGDNSPNSADSRFFGFVPAKALQGRVIWHFALGKPPPVPWEH